MESPSLSVHLVVLHHGLWGTDSHLNYLSKCLKEGHPEIEIYNCNENAGFQTYDGIDVCGDRLEAAVKKHVTELEKKNSKIVTHISFFGYSLGGLITRYAIGKLYAGGFFNNIEPVQFVTFASPHLGSGRPVDFFSSKIFNFGSAWLIHRTGIQLNLYDKFSWEKPLLVILTDPKFPFHRGLSLFKVRKCYANTRNDQMVRFTTASISGTNKFRRHHHTTVDPKYPSIVQIDENIPVKKESWKPKEIALLGVAIILSPLMLSIWLTLAISSLITIRLFRPLLYPTKTDLTWLENYLVDHKGSDWDLSDQRLIRKRMVESLDLMKWERVAVSLRFTNAHAAIVVRNSAFDQYSDVIMHFVDNFVKHK